MSGYENAPATGLLATHCAHTLRFTRRFTKGPLAGLTHDDTIGFCNAADCDEWVSVINAKNKAGKLEYFVEKWSVQVNA